MWMFYKIKGHSGISATSYFNWSALYFSSLRNEIRRFVLNAALFFVPFSIQSLKFFLKNLIKSPE
jgi:hypothetical protein